MSSACLHGAAVTTPRADINPAPGYYSRAKRVTGSPELIATVSPCNLQQGARRPNPFNWTLKF